MTKQKQNIRQKVGNLDPFWISRIYKIETGEDFLGLRAVQGNITNYLLPGIITLTLRARYYPFYSWLLVEYARDHPKGWSKARFIHRREQIFALANLAYSDLEDIDASVVGLTGSEKLSQHWKAHRDESSVLLSVDSYVKAKNGGYDNYSSVMRTLDLTRWSEDENVDLEITPRGQRLAEAFVGAIKDTTYYERRAKYDMATSIPRNVLVEYGTKCHVSRLALSPDEKPTLDALFAFDAPHLPPPLDPDAANLETMRGTLGLILEMLDQAQEPFSDDNFRQTIAYGLCADYDSYKPTEPLRPFLAHWQMFQLREYYVYALYALWTYFLHWLYLEGPQTLDAFCEHLNELNFKTPAAELGLKIPKKSAQKWSLNGWLDALLDASAIRGRSLKKRCETFSQQSGAPLNEHKLFYLLSETGFDDPSTFVGAAWLLLSSLYLRLTGLQVSDSWNAWHWARVGGARRRSMDLFVSDVSKCIEAQHSVIDTLAWIYKDYIIAQHTITALEKWRQRNTNTFHFNYRDGVFERVSDDFAAFSASRFPQAYTMLYDLGLYETSPEDQRPYLTVLGRRTYKRVLESCSG